MYVLLAPGERHIGSGRETPIYRVSSVRSDMSPLWGYLKEVGHFLATNISLLTELKNMTNHDMQEKPYVYLHLFTRIT
jgi:hypothetical protein